MRNACILTLAIVCIGACKRAETMTPEVIENPARKYAEMYTGNMAGLHLWQRFSYVGPFGKFDTTYFTDTTVVMEIINDTAIKFIGTTFQYVDSIYHPFRTDTASVLMYADKSPKGPHEGTAVYFYYKTGKLVYSDCSGGLGGQSCMVYRTK